MDNESLEQLAERLVRQNVNVCVSSLVSTLAAGQGGLGYAPSMRTLEDLCEQASELAAPVLDWEEAARQAGWYEKEGAWFTEISETSLERLKGSAEELCAAYAIDPYEWEVYEHWAISRWFGERLEAHGEKVDFDFAGMVVWARIDTGQSIAIDSVIEAIAKEVQS